MVMKITVSFGTRHDWGALSQSPVAKSIITCNSGVAYLVTGVEHVSMLRIFLTSSQLERNGVIPRQQFDSPTGIINNQSSTAGIANLIAVPFCRHKKEFY
jgi:hypothetical protein